MLFSASQIKLLELIATTVRGTGGKSFLIGGIVRDIMLDLKTIDRDIDVVVSGVSASKIALLVSERTGGAVREFNDFQTAKIVGPDRAWDIDEIDFATARSEVYSSPGALPTVQVATIDEDLKRRDFTINALALPLEEFVQLLAYERADRAKIAEIVIDHFTGLIDLKDRTIRTLHSKSFVDDPTRIFRALRYEARLSGILAPETETDIRRALAVGVLSNVSITRKLNEVRKILLEPNPYIALRSMEKHSLLSPVLGLTSGEADSVLQLVEDSQKFFPQLINDERLEFLLLANLSIIGAGSAESLLRPLGFGKRHIRKFSLILENLDRVSATKGLGEVLVSSIVAARIS